MSIQVPVKGTTGTALSFENLNVVFDTEFSEVHAVKGLTLEVFPGEVVALVGESGSGKSVTSTAAMGLLPSNANITGKALVGGVNVVGLPEAKMRKMRATEIAMVFQEPMTALNPVLTVERQLTESLELHGLAYGREATARAIELLEMVGIPEPAKRIKQYPHQFSGGQRQRIVIAMAISCDPKVIIADEPTTALDVTVQAEILDLLRELKDKLNTGILLITHNMGVVADLADRVAVMFRGSLVETGTVEQVLNAPQHPYTQKLLASVPRLEAVAVDGSWVAEPVAAVEPERKLVLEAKNLVLEYDMRGSKFRAVDDVSFEIARGEILGIVGESGSGKSTVAKAVLGLLPVASGTPGGAGQRPDQAAAQGRTRGARQDGRDLPGPGGLAEPAVPDRRLHHRTHGGAQGRKPRRTRQARQGVAGGGAPAGLGHQPLPARALRRPAPARVHRTRPDPGSRAADRRRADQRVGRFGAGRGAGDDPGTAGTLRVRLPVCQPRPGRRGPVGALGGCHEVRQGDRAGSRQRRPARAQGRVHAQAACGGPGSGAR